MTRRDLLVAFLPFIALLVGVWLSMVSTPGTPDGCPDGCARRAERAPGPLRVVGMNVLHGFPSFTRLAERLDLVADEIVRLDADVALLQEVPWTIGLGSGAERLAQRTRMNHLYLRANGNRFAIGFEEGSLLLSRFPLRDPAWIELEPHAGPFEHRVALTATVEGPTGPLRLVVTHLSGADEVSAGQAASLVTWIDGLAPMPIIVGGDLNAAPDSTTYRHLPWTDVHRSVHPDAPGPTCCIDDLEAPPPATMHERIDYLFSDELDPVAAEVVLVDPARVDGGWLRASDHAGLYAALGG